MCKVLRLALPVLLVAICALAVGSTPSQAACDNGAAIFLGLDGAPLNSAPASCGTSPSAVFWYLGHGDPVNGQGVDSGNSSLQYFDVEGIGGVFIPDWGNAGVDGCPLPSFPQSDGTFGPMAFVIGAQNNAGTPFHSSTLLAVSADFYEAYQYYDMDVAFGDISVPGHDFGKIDCNPLAAPAVMNPTSGPSGTSMTLSWPGVSSKDDCAFSPNLAPEDCAGGSRSILTGWNVYYANAGCKLGTLSSDSLAPGVWTKLTTTPLAAGQNSGAPLTFPNPTAPKCLFVAYSPVWDNTMEGQILSTPSAAVGGAGDQDGDGVTDHNDNCPTVANAGQADLDGDLIGDACDNCAGVVNYDQADANNNGVGDACDNCPTSSDTDHDGVCDPVDNCLNVVNPNQADADGDGLGDACDLCPLDPLNDVDLDGICGNVDNCPTVANHNQAEHDGDGKGDACDPCPYEKFDDSDGDGKCACDVALNNAGVCGNYPNITDGLGHPADNCPIIWNPTQTASGVGDGLGLDCEDTFVDPIDVMTTGSHTFSYAPCTVRFKTNAEWNCPKFRVKNLGATKATFPCANCTNGRGQKATFYGGDTGVSIGKCLVLFNNAFGVWVEAFRSNPNDCAGFVVAKQATKKFPYKLGKLR